MLVLPAGSRRPSSGDEEEVRALDLGQRAVRVRRPDGGRRGAESRSRIDVRSRNARVSRVEAVEHLAAEVVDDWRSSPAKRSMNALRSSRGE